MVVLPTKRISSMYFANKNEKHGGFSTFLRNFGEIFSSLPEVQDSPGDGRHSVGWLGSKLQRFVEKVTDFLNAKE